MPNHITNRLTIVADQERVQEILETIKYDDKGIGSIDFNKIIPMPDNIFRGNLGAEERQLYGKDNWYDWSVENWDTKWNSYGYDCFPPYEGGNQISFHTAWNRPESVISQLSKMFPDVQLRHLWADEDIGVNVGEVLYEDGEELEHDIPTAHSKEAYEMASDILDILLSEYDLYYDEKAGNYKYRNTTDEELTEPASVEDIHTSPDFQCDQTGGYPTSLVWNITNGTAILQPSPAFDDDSEGARQCLRDCADWGVRPCASWEDYNDLLESIGEEAYENAAVPLDDEDEEFGGLSLQ